MHQEVLSLMVKESVQAIEKLEQQTITQKADIKLKMKDLQIAKLQEQIEYRDQVIEEAKRIMKEVGIDNELVDDRIVELEDIVYDHGSLFNPNQRDSSQLKNYSKYSPRRNSTIGYQQAPNQPNSRRQPYSINVQNYMDRNDRNNFNSNYSRSEQKQVYRLGSNGSQKGLPQVLYNQGR